MKYVWHNIFQVLFYVVKIFYSHQFVHDALIHSKVFCLWPNSVCFFFPREKNCISLKKFKILVKKNKKAKFLEKNIQENNHNSTKKKWLVLTSLLFSSSSSCVSSSSSSSSASGPATTRNKYTEWKMEHNHSNSLRSLWS